MITMMVTPLYIRLRVIQCMLVYEVPKNGCNKKLVVNAEIKYYKCRRKKRKEKEKNDKPKKGTTYIYIPMDLQVSR